MRDDVEERYIFPQTLTEQKRLIGIPLDEATVGLTPPCIGIYFNQSLAGLIVGLLFWFALTHFKKGVLIHLKYEKNREDIGLFGI
ncbi:type IV conjugative transfer system protein TraL [Escherichia coli]|nr:type IV conjugative transfer system protein TraL [Escherichia coli]